MDEKLRFSTTFAWACGGGERMRKTAFGGGRYEANKKTLAVIRKCRFLKIR